MSADTERQVTDPIRRSELAAMGIDAEVTWSPDDRVTVTMSTCSLDWLLAGREGDALPRWWET